jgi:hypothetical protein
VQQNNNQNLLPTTTGVVYNINYYRNQGALAEINEITNICYRNIGYPNTQNIWVRVDSDVDNGYGLGPFVTLTVEKLPIANPFQFHDNAMTTKMAFYFNTSNLETTLLGTNQTFPVTVTFFDAVNNR